MSTNKSTHISKAQYLIESIATLLEAISVQAGQNTSPSMNPAETHKAGENTTATPGSDTHQAGENTTK